MDNQEFEIAGKRIFICEEHHHVLKFWQEFKEDRPYLLTFDHHTDLQRAFQHQLYSRHMKGKYASQEECYGDRDELLRRVADGDLAAIALLHHDEHIDTAIKSGIIHKALVYPEDSFYSRSADIYSINGEDDYRGQLIINNPRNHEDYDLAINTPQLVENFKRFTLCINQEEWIDNFILDIDLDFFKTRKAIEPDDSTFFIFLIKKSKAISIARETIWINTWRREHDEHLTVDFLLERVLALINEAQSE